MRSSSFWGHLQSYGHLYDIIFIFEVVFVFDVIFIFEDVILLKSSLFLKLSLFLYPIWSIPLIWTILAALFFGELRLLGNFEHHFRDLCTACALWGLNEELAIVLQKWGIGDLIIVFKCSCTFRAERGIDNFITQQELRNTSLAASGHSLTACNAVPPAKSKMAASGPQKGRRGLERGPILGYWVLWSTFAK